MVYGYYGLNIISLQLLEQACYSRAVLQLCQLSPTDESLFVQKMITL